MFPAIGHTGARLVSLPPLLNRHLRRPCLTSLAALRRAWRFLALMAKIKRSTSSAA